MIKNEKKTQIEGMNNAFFVEEHCEDEPISKNIFNSVNDFYNLVHLIKKSWFNNNYNLNMEDVGYNVYDENNDLIAWIGIKEKCNSIMFIIYTFSELYKKARKYLKGPMVIYDFDEDLWIYSELQISKIIKETSFEKQKEIIINWINEDIIKIL